MQLLELTGVDLSVLCFKRALYLGRGDTNICSSQRGKRTGSPLTWRDDSLRIADPWMDRCLGCIPVPEPDGPLPWRLP
jgi:hypothetical protein